MNYLFSFILIFSGISVAQAQNIQLSGQVNALGTPVENASVTLLKAEDSSLVKVEMTSVKGRFEFSVPANKYTLLITVTGYEPYSREVDLKADTILETTELELEIQQMEGIVVTAKKPLVEYKIDKMVVNVDASPSNAGATAMEVLEKSPGIIVNNDGGISLKGKSGVIVMMDGKPTYLSQEDLANLLKNTPASAIETIEIMSNPSARFDAAGNSGIINIKTKKNLKTGLNGSVTLGASASYFSGPDKTVILPKTQNSLNFNYRHNKVNIFGNYNPSYNQNTNHMRLTRNFYENGLHAGSARQEWVNENNNFNQNYKLGIDYFADKKNIFGVVFTGFNMNLNQHSNTFSNIYDSHGAFTSALKTNTDNKLYFNNYSINLNYKHSFDSTGRELTIDADYVKYDNMSNIMMNTHIANEGKEIIGRNELSLKGKLPSHIDIYSLKSDYIHPLKNDWKLETGFKVNYITSDNVVDYQRQVGTNWVNDARSNHFTYKENINAAYVTVQKKINDKWSAQAGLRAENTNTKGVQHTNDSSFTRNYINLFPTAYVNYILNDNNNITATYSRRVNRPNYQNLNPFVYFLDSLTYNQGNPYLLPQFSNNIELSHAFKGKYVTTLNYSRTTDVISEVLRQDAANKTVYQTVENISSLKNIGISVNAPFKWAPWFTSNIYATVFNNKFEGEFKDEPVLIQQTTGMVNITNSFTLQQGFTAEVSGFYRSKAAFDMFVMNEMYQMSVALQKTVLEGKGTVRLNLRDPFGWQRFGAITRYADVDVTLNNRWDTRQLTASFTWRFGKSTIEAARKRSSGVADELNRAGGNN